MSYQIPKIFKNKTVFILGGGPSLPDLVQGLDLSTTPVIGINNAFRLGKWVDVCWFADARFFWWHKDALSYYQGLILTYNRHPENLPSLDRMQNVNIVNGRSGHGLSNTCIKFNASSGGSSINVAFQLGAKRVVLLGFDMRRVDGESNWWRYDHPKTNKGYDAFIKPFTKIKQDADKLGLEILNATPDSALTMFPFVRADAYIN